MKFHFKVQQYQTDAVEAVVRVFSGQDYHDKTCYLRDLGKDRQIELTEEGDTGYQNAPVELSDEQLLSNIRQIQRENDIRLSGSLVKDLGRCSLDVEMETGTGKTYVYIKTMFELNKRYGWSKFIVVVPSVAIREGVKNSFEMTAEHFMEHYGKKARAFVYSSGDLTRLDHFSADAGINVMIINTQAFAASMKEDGRSKEARIIYSERDAFGSRRPIDVLAANRPILILDEPQKMGKGDSATQKALQRFDPLFSLNYSATHAVRHDLVYVMDAVDAFNKRLVKKIEVKGFEVRNLRGTDRYLFLEQIVLSPKKPPMARIELEVSRKSGSRRERHVLGLGDDLYRVSRQMEQYRGYAISDIDPALGTVTFTNGEALHTGDVMGDVSKQDMRRIQIRETILSHFEKEEKLFQQGIKTLSLFFIDEVSKYRRYDENGAELLGEYGQVFEEEYRMILEERLPRLDPDYRRYLDTAGGDISRVHKGYFSIDSRTGRSVNSTPKRGSEFSDDISAYDLILKNKERLLSFEEPTRFLFSHSALREGWDNPNVFQICTLKHSDSQTAKRQEVGRGLRLCVDQRGSRMDEMACGEAVHEINVLTVIASESYKAFVTDLQSDIKKVLYDRPMAATREYFTGKYVQAGGERRMLDAKMAGDIEFYLIKHDYIGMDRRIEEKYRADLRAGTLAPMPAHLAPMAEGIHKLIQAIFDEHVLNEMISNGHGTKVEENPLNERFYSEEFQALWEQLRRQYAYTVDIDSEELIRRATASVNEKLTVSQLQYTTTVGRQKNQMERHELERGEAFRSDKIRTRTLRRESIGTVRYDLVGKVAEGTTLTRRTAAKILAGLREDKLLMLRYNPEEFITKVVRLINDQRAGMIVDSIRYAPTGGVYDSGIFTAEKTSRSLDQVYRAGKAIQDYVFTHGSTEKSVERRFAEELDAADEVRVYAKLPKKFHIPTPLGNYSPDWAIVFKAGTVKHVFFLAETKGAADEWNLRPIEQAKIECAKKLFNQMSGGTVKFHEASDYQSLLDAMETL